MKFYFTGLAIGFAFLLFGGEKAVARFLAQNGLNGLAGAGVGTGTAGSAGANGTSATSGGCSCNQPLTNPPNPITNVAAPSGPSNYIRTPGAQNAAPLPVDFGRSLYPLGFSTFLEPEQVQ